MIPVTLLLLFLWGVTAVWALGLIVQIRNATFDLGTDPSFWALFYFIGFGALATAISIFVKSRWR